jgi:CheY-specific phosphatase CheX
MKMELIQPFINAADAILAESLQGATRIEDVSMEPEVYHRKGIAAKIIIRGDIEGRVIFDLEPSTAHRVASFLAGTELPESDSLIRETIFELANQVIGNAVTTLNDQGFSFKVFPPELHNAEDGFQSTEDTEALVMCFETRSGPVYMNIAMHYNRRRRGEKGGAN